MFFIFHENMINWILNYSKKFKIKFGKCSMKHIYENNNIKLIDIPKDIPLSINPTINFDGEMIDWFVNVGLVYYICAKETISHTQ